jgi:RNA-binding protein
LRGLAHDLDPLFQIGKNGFTPEITEAVSEALETKELLKINVLKNCSEDPKEIGPMLAERTRSTLVQVMGRRITLYKESTDNKTIEIPKAKK